MSPAGSGILGNKLPKLFTPFEDRPEYWDSLLFMQFEQKLIHPGYGEGRIVRKTDTGPTSSIYVDFPNFGVKCLNAKWVAQNCQVSAAE